jgi:antitoxin CptB
MVKAVDKLAQIRFLCRRGLKELDLIFQSYLKNHAHHASDKELKQLIILLKKDDQSLLEYILNTPIDLSDERQELRDKLRNR